MYSEGVSYYVIDHDYSGLNKQVFIDVFTLETLYINDIIIRYDWKSGLSFVEDSVTHEMTDPVKLGEEIVAMLESDSAVHKWMYRKNDFVDEY